MKDISVIIPVYNTEKYVGECIESVVAQKDVDLEIIIIDDGSTDNSLEICKKYERLYNNIKVLHTENRGLSSARNLGISFACGTYLHFIDSDDFLPNDKIYSHMFNKIQEKAVDLIIGRTVFYNHDKTFCTGEDKKFNIEGKQNCPIFETIIKNKIYSIQSSACNKIIKREFIIRNNLFFIEKLLHEDDMWLGLCFGLNPSTYIYDELIYAVRRRDNSIMRTVNPKIIHQKATSKLLISSKLCNMISKCDINLDVRKQLYANYISFFIDGIKSYYKIEDKTAFLKEVKQYKKVLKFSTCTDSKNLMALYYLSIILPERLLVKIILKRYNVKK